MIIDDGLSNERPIRSTMDLQSISLTFFRLVGQTGFTRFPNHLVSLTTRLSGYFGVNKLMKVISRSIGR